ncbi:hypothetical protein OMK64_12165 [Cellulomonas fimi]|uniref:DUF6891 domain-containing protein n=1 Tax=Cellulomonas fimi TaxID=1708 RepID=UPI00234C81CC|nr:hypothetical protein [Cellulomonas fimi]MDC7122292.1 hypothetical protein [Cellulomonas fimi]
MSFLDRLRRRNTTPVPRPADGVPADEEVTEADLVEIAEQAVLPGFLTRSEAVERLREAFELDDADPTPGRIVELVWSRRSAEQATWEGRSDFDRLDAAFRRLESEGFVARMNFTCCTTCGTDEIDDERTPLDTATGYPYRETMYTFFHQQDADRLVDEQATLFLAYSSWRPAPDTDPDLLAAARAGDEAARAAVVAHTDVQVGHKVVDALKSEGLDVTWDGSHETRIAIAISDWRKPLPV